MPTFFSRRYMRRTDAVGNTEKAMGIFILVLVAGIVAAFIVQVTGNKDYLFDVAEAGPRVPAETDDPFPDSGLPGWQRPDRVSRYTPDNLYVKIDGRADAYLRFHVVGLTFGTYRHQVDGDRAIDVYWYNMGEPANATGMYRAEAPPDAAPAPVGQEGYQVGGAVFFHKGSSYLQVLPTGVDEAEAQAALTIAGSLDELIAP